MLKKSVFGELLLLIFFLLLIASCETNPPNSALVQYGTLNVSSNLDGQVDSIKIFVNGDFSGKFSPAKLTLETGEYSVYLQYDTVKTAVQTISISENETKDLQFVFNLGISKRVLLEDFANVSCDPCVTSSAILQNLLHGDFSNGELIVLRYATNFPSPNDPFYLANPELFDARINYYNVLFAPTTIVDGIAKPISTDSVEIHDAIQQALSVQTNFNIEVTSNITNDDSVKVNVRVTFSSGESLENLALFTVLVKDSVSFSEPPGSNGETEFYDVVVDMLPDANGVELSNKEKSELNFNYSVLNTYGLTEDNFSVVSFIQNKDTKEIIQTNKNN